MRRVGGGTRGRVGEVGAPPVGDGPDGEGVLDDEGVLGDEAREDQIQEELADEEVERRAARAGTARGDRRPGAFRRLYRGETSFPFVERRRWWLVLSSIVILAGLGSLGIRGLNLGITFRGGTAWTVAAPGATQRQATAAVQAAGLSQPTVELLGTGSRQHIQVQADLNSLTGAHQKAETTRVIDALAHLAHVAPRQVSVTHVGPTWGGQVTNRAVIALIVFLALVAVYISIRFEPKMAVAAFVALLHDLLVTAGVYSLAGFQVTPDTVIAVLTILGYSLYDTVVVFDRVRDNAKGLGSSGRLTYSEMVDLSMNQTLARSVNTSLVAILPVLAVLLIGAGLLGATTLQNYGLALVVGLLSGAYSSIFIASPILAFLKEREPRYVAMRQRIEAKGERLGRLSPSAAAALVSVGAGPRTGPRQSATGAAGAAGTLRPGQARTKGRPQGQGERRESPAGTGGALPTGSSPAAGSARGTTSVAAPVTSARSGDPASPDATFRGGKRAASGTGGAATRRPPPRKGGKGKKRR